MKKATPYTYRELIQSEGFITVVTGTIGPAGVGTACLQSQCVVCFVVSLATALNFGDIEIKNAPKKSPKGDSKRNTLKPKLI
jgi:hypothetical protein